MSDHIAAARSLIEPLHEYREQQTVAGGSWWEAPEICTQAADAIVTLADALDAERARAEKAEAERDTAWDDAIEVAKGCVDDNHPFIIMDEMDLLKKGNSHNRQVEHDQALARVAAAYEAATMWLIEAGIAGDHVSDPLASCIRALTPADAEAALQRVVDATWDDAIEAAARVQDIAHQYGANAAGQHHAILALKRPEASHE